MVICACAALSGDGGLGQTFKQGDALGQGRLEIGFAVHTHAGGDLHHLIADGPAAAASSSMHSCRIMVESMSARSSRLRRFVLG